MLILAVDTSTREYSLAVLRGQTVLAEISNSSDEPYSSRLFSDLEILLGQAGLALNQIELFAVAAGPGSFTGLRVGLAAVKAWAEAYNKPVAPVSGLEAVAAQIARAQAQGTILAPVVDARRGQIYGGVYRCEGSADSALTLLGQEVVEGAEEFVAMVTKQSNGASPVFVSPTPEVIRPALELSVLSAARVEKVSHVLAPVIGRLGHYRALRGEVVDALNLDANYVRRTDAELHWKVS